MTANDPSKSARGGARIGSAAFSGIRRFRRDDACALAEIYISAIRERASTHYSPAQIRAWLSLAPSPERITEHYQDGRTALVAVDAHDGPVGFSDLEASGHIQFLYVSPRAAGLGVARELLGEIELAARRARIETLCSEASEPAVGVFERSGFQRLMRRDLTIGDIRIHNYAVRKRL